MGLLRRPGFPRQREAGASPLVRPQWRQAGPRLPDGPLPPGTLRLHLCPAGQLPAEWNRQELLSAQERARVQQLRPGMHRDAWLAAHLMLRQVLAGTLGEDPGRLRFERLPCLHCGTAHGRPVLAGEAGRTLHFSISHGAGLALVAIAGLPCGVDVEAVPASHTIGAVQGQLHRAERTELTRCPEPERGGEFARIWTRKEAWLKATGAGLRGGLDSFYAGVRAGARPPRGAWFADGVLGEPELGGQRAAGIRGGRAHWAVAVQSPAPLIEAFQHGPDAR